MNKSIPKRLEYNSLYYRLLNCQIDSILQIKTYHYLRWNNSYEFSIARKEIINYTNI
jgi:hypothetical protein